MLILASASPRRSMLLTEQGYEFRVISSSVDESLPGEINIEEGVQVLALRKAVAGAAVWREKGGNIADVVLGADTLVVLDGQPLGKPKDAREAEAMLKALSGKTHMVYTGVALVGLNGSQETGAVKTEVAFRELSPDEIHTYVKTGEPLDKAGAYGIQGEGRNFVSSVKGSFSNVIGLPMEYLGQRLKAWNQA